MKLVRVERESAALEHYLSSARRLSSSAIVAVELMLAARRANAGDAVRRATDLLAAVSLVDVNGDLLERAGRLAPTNLRALDAIHLAAALSLGGRVDAFVAYDRRLAWAARDFGLQVIAPGAEASIA